MDCLFSSSVFKSFLSFNISGTISGTISGVIFRFWSVIQRPRLTAQEMFHSLSLCDSKGAPDNVPDRAVVTFKVAALLSLF